MKQQLLLKLVSFFLFAGMIYSCKTDAEQSANRKKQQKKQVEHKNQENKRKPIFGDEPLEKEPFDMYECYPLNSIYIFEYPVGNSYFDKLWKKYKTDSSSEVIEEKEVCLGDYCQSYQELTHGSDKMKVFFFKGEAGEYGFGNSQYIFRNDSLMFSRIYKVEIYEFPSDSTLTAWAIRETINRFDLKSGKVAVEYRETISDSLSRSVISLKSIPKVKSKRSYPLWKKQTDNEIAQKLGMKNRTEKFNKMKLS